MSASVREFTKSVARLGASVLVLPFLFSYWLKSPLLGRDRALEGSSQALSVIPGLIGRYLRQVFLGRVLVQCHPTSVVEFGTLFSQTGARIDERVYVGPNCHLGLVHIEAYAMLGPAVQVPSGAQTHQYSLSDEPIQLQRTNRQLVRIGSGSWIGSGAIIMADIGRNTIVGAGAVVTRPLPDNVVAVGLPARVIRHRTATTDREPN